MSLSGTSATAVLSVVVDCRIEASRSCRRLAVTSLR